MKSLTAVDYARICDRCSKYISPQERINSVGAHYAQDGDLVFGWLDGKWCNRLCDKCYFAARLEGAL